jgi:CRISPR-associated protein Csd1
MILQALADYYHRKASDPESGIAAPGFEWKEIPFIIVLKPDGNPVAIESTFEGDGKARRAKRFLVPMAVKKTSGIASNLLWDNVEYVLGIVLKGKPERVQAQHTEFVRRIEQLGKCDDAGLAAVRKFLDKPQKAETLSHLPGWDELVSSGLNLSFRMVGQNELVLDCEPVRMAITRSAQELSNLANEVCLVSGEQQPIERLHTAIKGVRNAQSSGANIVSFNLAPFASYNKQQGANAPVGKSAAFAYVTAINHLLGKDSNQRMLIGDATTIFWSQKPSKLETEIVDIFDEPPKDDPDRGTKAVRNLFDSVTSGTMQKVSGNNEFYVLGLAPNASRIAVRFWVVDTIANMSEKILQHFRDLRIARSPKDREYLSLFRLLVAIAPQGKSENIPPNLAGDTIRSILEGLPYPRTLLQALVRRIRAEHDISYPRASLIKACINRTSRFANPEIKEELKVSLDSCNINLGYRLGRLFATLEKIQGEANPGINATIRDRFYGAASGTPVAVFSNLLRLTNHHLAKLESKGRRIFFEKLIAEIMEALTDFPGHLSLADQGRFAIGYYHQIQEFYTKRSAALDGLTPSKGENAS